jgi:hypothetical protein
MLKELHNQAWQLTAVIPTTQEAERGGSREWEKKKKWRTEVRG